MANSLYDGIISPQGGLYQAGPEVVMPGNVTAEGLAIRSVPTYSVDNYGNPILEQQQSNAVAQALGRANGRATGGGADAVAAALLGANQPDGSVVAGKRQDRMASGPAGWDPTYGYAPTPKPTTALAAIDAAVAPDKYGKFRFTGSDPFDSYKGSYVASARPAPAMQRQAPDGGVFGIPMSPGMSRNIAGKAGVSALPGIGGSQMRASNRTQQALAQVAASRPAPAPMYQSNGVANPAYRDYSGINTSQGGGIAPSSSSGSFTDSLGGTYYDRHL